MVRKFDNGNVDISKSFALALKSQESGIKGENIINGLIVQREYLAGELSLLESKVRKDYNFGGFFIRHIIIAVMDDIQNWNEENTLCYAQIDKYKKIRGPIIVIHRRLMHDAVVYFKMKIEIDSETNTSRIENMALSSKEGYNKLLGAILNQRRKLQTDERINVGIKNGLAQFYVDWDHSRKNK